MSFWKISALKSRQLFQLKPKPLETNRVWGVELQGKGWNDCLQVCSAENDEQINVTEFLSLQVTAWAYL